MSDELNLGLDGVLVTESSLSHVDGETGRLIYRGYAIEDLAREASFEEVLYLLWHGELPDADALSSFEDALADERPIDDDVVETLRALAAADETPMAALRTATSMLSAYEPEHPDPEDLDASLRQGRRITAKMPTILAAYDRLRDGDEPIEPRDDLGHAANFLYMRDGEEPDEVAVETLDQALTLHADHGLNASTFTTVVVSSTLADVYNAITAGIGALAGPLHGGANQDVMDILLEIDDSDLDPREWVEEAIDEGRRIPGFGHRVYQVKDPRALILEERSAELADSTGDDRWYDYAKTIEDYLTDEVGLVEKGIAPNVDFYSGSVYYQLGMPADMYTPIFVMSRVGGWLAHALEYRENNRIIRPRARYVGETDAEFVPIDQR